MLAIEPTTAESVADLRREYVGSLAAPLDGMWESFSEMSAHWEILNEAERIGYCCVNDEDVLLQFHVSPRFVDRAREAFAEAIHRTGALGASVSTFEPWLTHCLDRHERVRVHTYLYHDHGRPAIPLAGFDGASLDQVPESERESTEKSIRDWLNDDSDWLTGYLERLVARGELLVLRDGATPLGIGELRVSDTQPPYADLGVIVSPGHRGRGLAPHILWRLKERCYASGLSPICSTTVDNPGAQRAIEKAGFVNRHRIVEVLFRTDD